MANNEHPLGVCSCSFAVHRPNNVRNVRLFAQIVRLYSVSLPNLRTCLEFQGIYFSCERGATIHSVRKLECIPLGAACQIP
jgi:hypothetical protein